jgi:hypothetical protein
MRGLMRPGEVRDVARLALDRAACWRMAVARGGPWIGPMTRVNALARAREALALARGARLAAEYAGAVLPW